MIVGDCLLTVLCRKSLISKFCRHWLKCSSMSATSDRSHSIYSLFLDFTPRFLKFSSFIIIPHHNHQCMFLLYRQRLLELLVMSIHHEILLDSIHEAISINVKKHSTFLSSCFTRTDIIVSPM